MEIEPIVQEVGDAEQIVSQRPAGKAEGACAQRLLLIQASGHIPGADLPFATIGGDCAPDPGTCRNAPCGRDETLVPLHLRRPSETGSPHLSQPERRLRAGQRIQQGQPGRRVESGQITSFCRAAQTLQRVGKRRGRAGEVECTSIAGGDQHSGKVLDLQAHIIKQVFVRFDIGPDEAGVGPPAGNAVEGGSEITAGSAPFGAETDNGKTHGGNDTRTTVCVHHDTAFRAAGGAYAFMPRRHKGIWPTAPASDPAALTRRWSACAQPPVRGGPLPHAPPG